MASEAHHIRGCWVRFAIDLHPSQSTDVLQGVREQLQSMLLRYSHELQGVMLAYSKEKILNSEAKIHPYFPYFHVNVSALVFLFRPIIGSLMTGVVNAVGHDYIGMLVLGIFNAAIGREEIPSHWRSAPLERCWLSTRNARQRIKVGTSLRFAVHRTHHEGGFFTLAGSLNRPGVSLDAISAPPAGTHSQAARWSTAAATEDSAQRHRKRASLPAANHVAPRHAGSQDRLPSQPQTHQQHQAAAAAVTKPLQPQHIRNDGVAATETVSRARKRKRHKEDAHADTGTPAAATANVSTPTAEPRSGQDGTGWKAAAARKLLKRQRKAAAAGANAAALPAGSAVADQPNHKSESSRRRSEAASVTTGAATENGLSSTVKQPKKKKRKTDQIG